MKTNSSRSFRPKSLVPRGGISDRIRPFLKTAAVCYEAGCWLIDGRAIASARATIGITGRHIERRGVGGQAAQRLLLASPGSANFLVKRRGRGERAPSLEERRWSGRGEGGSLENRFCRRISKDWRGGVVGVKGLRESSSVNYLYQSLEIHSSKEDDFIV